VLTVADVEPLAIDNPVFVRAAAAINRVIDT